MSTFAVSFKGSITIDPADFLECETIEDVDIKIEDYILEDTCLDSEYLDEWDLDDDFYSEWKRLKEEDLKERQIEYDEFN